MTEDKHIVWTNIDLDPEDWYTPYIESDHHVDFENIPPEAEEVLSYATGEDLSQNGGIRY